MIMNHRRHAGHDHSLFSRYVFSPRTPRGYQNLANGLTFVIVRNLWASSVYSRDDCEPADPLNTLTDRLNTLLNSSGTGYTLPLCPGVQYYIQAPIVFAAPNQEISTVGYPTGDQRAILVVSGPVFNGTGHTTAVDGTCVNCGGVKLRNIQVRLLRVLMLFLVLGWHVH